tara:strand:+ start:26 stop:217 length:192 start_codon:yes stop_codon:yes gene_type:complete
MTLNGNHLIIIMKELKRLVFGIKEGLRYNFGEKYCLKLLTGSMRIFLLRNLCFEVLVVLSILN